jgi:hypothetical protein
LWRVHSSIRLKSWGVGGNARKLVFNAIEGLADKFKSLIMCSYCLSGGKPLNEERESLLLGLHITPINILCKV